MQKPTQNQLFDALMMIKDNCKSYSEDCDGCPFWNDKDGCYFPDEPSEWNIDIPKQWKAFGG